MVAEAEPKVTQRRKPNTRSGSGPAIPLLAETRVRNLYLGHFLGPQEIAAQTGLNYRQVTNLISRKGWATLRASKRKRVEESAIARAEESVSEIVNAVAMETEELTLGTLAKAKVTLERTDRDAARDLQAYSQAAKNFNGIMREARNLNAHPSEGGNTLNVMFVGALPRSQSASASAPRNVTPNTDSQTTVDVAASVSGDAKPAPAATP